MAGLKCVRCGDRYRQGVGRGDLHLGCPKSEKRGDAYFERIPTGNEHGYESYDYGHLRCNRCGEVQPQGLRTTDKCGRPEVRNGGGPCDGELVEVPTPPPRNLKCRKCGLIWKDSELSPNGRCLRFDGLYGRCGGEVWPTNSTSFPDKVEELPKLHAFPVPQMIIGETDFRDALIRILVARIEELEAKK